MLKEPAHQPNWSQFYDYIKDQGPSIELLQTLILLDFDPDLIQPLYAVDLGCGEGRDTRELLRRGWQVLAVDSCAEGIRRLEAHPDSADHEQLETRVESAADATWSNATLIYASRVLPFLSNDEFTRLWKKVADSVERGSYFSCTLFGDRHDFASDPSIRCRTAAQVQELFSPFEIIAYDEVEQDTLSRNTPFHCHMFNVIAKRKLSSAPHAVASGS